MRVVLAFPFRDDAAFTRSVAFEVVKSRLGQLYPFDKVLTVDSKHVPFNRAATRNLAVREAEKEKADVVVLCDADSIPQREPLREAIRAAGEDSLVHYPFNQVWEMAPKAIHLVRVGRTAEQLRNRAYVRYGPSQGGIWILRPSVWWAAGGQDERLDGWGCEDRAFLAAANTLVGSAVHHEGVLMCLYHQRPPASEQWKERDVHLLKRYESAIGDPNKTKEIINERLDDSGSIVRPTEDRSGAFSRVPGELHSRHRIDHSLQPDRSEAE